MINLTNVKYVIFDFDDTLCIHLKHNDLHYNEIKFNSDCLKNQINWKTCESNLQLKNFMNYCAYKNIKMGLSSWIYSCIEAESKIAWVKENYGYTLQNFCVGTSEMKINILKSLAQNNKIDFCQILLVDDRYETLVNASNIGFQTASPLQIVNFINNRKDFIK